jgi:hypothetical protein
MDEMNNMGKANHKLGTNEKAIKATLATAALRPMILNRPRMLGRDAK